jgi:hypothetical protein
MGISSEQLALALRKQQLQFQIASQRAVLAERLSVIVLAQNRFEQVARGIVWLRHHRVLVASVLAFYVAARPRLAGHWLRRCFALWQAYRHLKSRLFSNLAP